MTSIDPKILVQKVDMGPNTLKIHCPCAISISGQSRAGKSSWMVRLVENRDLIFDAKFDRIIYCESETLSHQKSKIFDAIQASYPGSEHVFGLPDIHQLQLTADPSTFKLILLDDLMLSLLKSESMVELVTILVSHSKCVLAYSVHNSFFQTKFAKTMQRNTDIRILFYNRLDQTELRIISCQLGKKSTFLLECFKFLHEKFPEDLYPYILISGQPQNKQFYVRTHIFPNANGEVKPIIFFET
jgi:hypothetical protein